MVWDGKLDGIEMPWLRTRSWDLLAISVTLFLASFSQVVPGLPIWFAWTPVIASTCIVMYLLFGVVWYRYFGAGQYIGLEEASCRIIPKLPLDIRAAIARMMSEKEQLQPSVLSATVALLSANDRPTLYGKVHRDTALEKIPEEDLERMHKISDGDLVCLVSNETLWTNVSMKREDIAELSKSLIRLYEHAAKQLTR
jgi:hypothetical protein